MKKREFTFYRPLILAPVEYISDYLLHAYWLNCFSRAEGVPKAIENTWTFVQFIVLCSILHFARSSAHTKDTYDYLGILWIFWLSMQTCLELAKVRVENEWVTH